MKKRFQLKICFSNTLLKCFLFQAAYTSIILLHSCTPPPVGQKESSLGIVLFSGQHNNSCNNGSPTVIFFFSVPQYKTAATNTYLSHILELNFWQLLILMKNPLVIMDTLNGFCLLQLLAGIWSIIQSSNNWRCNDPTGILKLLQKIKMTIISSLL